jgi:hypothetical protein
MQSDADVLSTWTDQLNAALQPLGILLSGVDAASILSLPGRGSALEKLRSVTEAEIALIADATNHYCETDRIEASHIRKAVEGTKWHWRDE